MQYLCGLCDYVYDEGRGDPLQGIPPGTLWAALPEGWCCPECGLSGTEFHPLSDAGKRREKSDHPRLRQEAEIAADAAP